jgi:hypothetical protein
MKMLGQALVLLMASSAALAQESSGEWRQSVAIYGMGAAIDGNASVGPLTVPVDLSISDLFSNLDMGAMAAYRVENGTWSFTGDVTYMDLGFSRTTDQGRAGARLGTEQLVVMGTVGRRLSPNVEALFSLAYFDVSSDLELRVLNQTRSASSGADWVDPLVGLEYRTPVGGKWDFSLRGDVGGFGVGSDLTMHGWAKFVRRNSDTFSWYVGYRFIGFDYETGSGLNYQRYDLQQHGPGAGIAFKF